MNNCIAQRLTEIVVVLAIVILLTLLLILWGGSGSAGIASPRHLNGSVLLLRKGQPILEGSHRWSPNDNRIAAAVAAVELDEEKKEKGEESSWNHWKSELFPRDVANTEYVMLAKSDRNSYEDHADGFDEFERYYSGNFRRSHSKVWDPHPQYDFEAFGHRFKIRLKEDRSFALSTLTIMEVYKNSTWRENPNDLGCFYTGYLEGDPKSDVAVSLCHGMTGHIKTSTGNYLIKPTEMWKGDETNLFASIRPLQHLIYRFNWNKFKSFAYKNYSGTTGNFSTSHNNVDDGVHTWEIIDDSREKKMFISQENMSIDVSRTVESDAMVTHGRRYRRYVPINTDIYYDEEDEEPDFESSNYNWRTRRALPREYFIEVMVVVDSTMINYHGAGLYSYILLLMNAVSRIFKDPSIGNPISIAVINIKPTYKVFGRNRTKNGGIEASEMFKKFCDWQSLQNPLEPSPDHYDIAILLTRENLCSDVDKDLCTILGLASIGTICSTNKSCAIIQDTGLASIFTISHEIGHVLNMPHNDDDRCKEYHDKPVNKVMSRVLDSSSIPWEWSKCSRHHLTDFLNGGFGNCLLDVPDKVMTQIRSSRLPGQVYSQNKQCELVHGKGWVVCFQPMEAVCRRLWCKNGKLKQSSCRTTHSPWADGTVCSPGRWCQRGECVTQLKVLEPVDGQWSEWSNYGECSRTCGGGIKKKQRHCNNPAPKNGGNYCIGERVRYRSCATRDCPTGSVDFREEQCSKFNDNHNITDIAKNVKWHAMYEISDPKDRCKLYCQLPNKEYRILQKKVVDGTPCGLDTFDVCVDGHCKPAGCDHVLNSKASFDACGVCQGDNSTCQRISGTFNASTEYGYNKVTTIPAGSSYIDIRQYSWKGLFRDNNYLALRLKDSNTYILNGNRVIKTQNFIFHLESKVKIEYSGCNRVIERINISGPIQVDLLLEVLTVGNLDPPQITYEYTVPKKILSTYTWQLGNWTHCSRMCRGTTHRQVLCRSTESKDDMPDDYCPVRERPREETRSCNNDCELQWQEVPNSRTECSNDCGQGTLQVKWHCVQVTDSRRSQQVPLHVCDHLKRPQEVYPCVGSCDKARWKYGEWGDCSVTCGKYGLRRRTAHCIDANNNILADESCSYTTKIVSQSCGHKPCPIWTFGDWGQCSVSCGHGKRMRQHWCRVDNSVVNSSLCSDQPARTVESCYAGPCSTWHASDWSPCTATCGVAVKQRTVVCKYTNGSLSKDCDSSLKPINIISCALQPCLTYTLKENTLTTKLLKDKIMDVHENDINNHRSEVYKWTIEGFEECSKSCGRGFTRQIIKCISTKDGQIAPQIYCKLKSRPADVIPCNEHKCPDWQADPWSQCDVKCGDGYQLRQISCRDSRGEVMNDNVCSEKPRLRRIRKCRKAPCISSQSNANDNHTHNFTTYKWLTGSWSACMCGKKGKQVRRLLCVDSRGRKMHRRHCPPELRPHRKRKCTRPTSCLDLKSQFNRDGEYMMLVGDRCMSIYCYGMNGSYPQEYLTLPTGESENYAEIYDKRLKNPRSCPYEGRRNESCECLNDTATVSGRTMFKKVRLNVRTLHIIPNDYRFADKYGENNIEYGKAGDCYSDMDCPQGRFEINLNGTPLVLSSDVHWPKQKNSFAVINKINNQRVIGRCGGYCGFCRPSPGLKLKVQPP